MMVCPEGAIKVTGRGLSPDDLLPLPPAGERATPKALEALMLARRSVRRFQDREVEPALLRRLVDMAETAPMGIPPSDIGCLVITGRESVQALADDIIKGYEGFLKIFQPWLLKLMRPFVGQPTYEAFRFFIRPLAETYVSSHRAGRDRLFYDAPAVLIFHASPYAEVTDAVIAGTYAMLAAEALGLGCTVIGGATPILQRNPALSARLGIPAGNKAHLTLIVGHRATGFHKAVRRHFTSVAGLS